MQTSNKRNAFWYFCEKKCIHKREDNNFSSDNHFQSWLKNTMPHCSQPLEEVMQFLPPNQLWNLPDGHWVPDVVLKMLLFPHVGNHSRLLCIFCFKKSKRRKKLAAQAPSVHAFSHPAFHFLVFSQSDENGHAASRSLAYLDNHSLAQLATYWHPQTVLGLACPAAVLSELPGFVLLLSVKALTQTQR